MPEIDMQYCDYEARRRGVPLFDIVQEELRAAAAIDALGVTDDQLRAAVEQSRRERSGTDATTEDKPRA